MKIRAILETETMDPEGFLSVIVEPLKSEEA